MRTDIESQLKSCPACRRWTITKVYFSLSTPRQLRSSSFLALFSIFTNFGFPCVIQSDNGTEFVNAIVHHLTTSFHIDHRLSTPYHPRANGLAERSVQTSCHAIRKLWKVKIKDGISIARLFNSS
ncbi:hypothetical protein BASA83_007038 [Batrachochytrium salamandrivorans]|nr:hypothetical protein BASA83_007038 [Batrachochytrium salamandrivorans]